MSLDARPDDYHLGQRRIAKKADLVRKATGIIRESTNATEVEAAYAAQRLVEICRPDLDPIKAT
jgi:hypothetical protein